MLKKFFCSTFIVTSSTLFCADTSTTPTKDISDTDCIMQQVVTLESQIAALATAMSEHMNRLEYRITRLEQAASQPPKPSQRPKTRPKRS